MACASAGAGGQGAGRIGGHGHHLSAEGRGAQVTWVTSEVSDSCSLLDDDAGHRGDAEERFGEENLVLTTLNTCCV